MKHGRWGGRGTGKGIGTERPRAGRRIREEEKIRSADESLRIAAAAAAAATAKSRTKNLTPRTKGTEGGRAGGRKDAVVSRRKLLRMF